MDKKLYIKQDQASSSLTIACRLVTDDDPQIQLVPGEWVKIAVCKEGIHILRVGTILGRGYQKAILELRGGTFNGSNKIEDIFFSPADGNRYEIKVAP